MSLAPLSPRGLSVPRLIRLSPPCWALDGGRSLPPSSSTRAVILTPRQPPAVWNGRTGSGARSASSTISSRFAMTSGTGCSRDPHAMFTCSMRSACEDGSAGKSLRADGCKSAGAGRAELTASLPAPHHFCSLRAPDLQHAVAMAYLVTLLKTCSVGRLHGTTFKGCCRRRGGAPDQHRPLLSRVDLTASGLKERPGFVPCGSRGRLARSAGAFLKHIRTSTSLCFSKPRKPSARG